MAGIGFLYWIVASKFYSPTQVGLAATFFSVASLINGFATLGFNTTLLRYLPNSKAKDREINTSFTVVATAAFFIGLTYLLTLPILTNKLVFIEGSIPLIILIIFFFPLNTVNAITDSVFTALREAEWVFVSNFVQSISKLVALITLSSLGVWGIIGSNIFGVVVAVGLCLLIIILRYHVHFRLSINNSVLKEVRKYAFGNYVSGIIGALPSLLLPLIITSRISPEQTAYFYMPNMIGGLLGIIPSTISRSYFTERSHSEKPVQKRNPIILTFSILLPFVLLLVLFGKKLLSLFGHNYSINGYNYLVLVSISVLISVINYFLGTDLLVDHKMKSFTLIASAGSLIYILGALLLTSKGIIGIGIASIASQLVSFILLQYFINISSRTTSKRV